MRFIIILLLSFSMYGQSWYQSKEIVIKGTNIEHPDWYPDTRIHFEKVRDSLSIYVTGYGIFGGYTWNPGIEYWIDGQKDYDFGSMVVTGFDTDKIPLERMGEVDLFDMIKEADTLYVSLVNVNGPKTSIFVLDKKLKKRLKRFGRTKYKSYISRNAKK